MTTKTPEPKPQTEAALFSVATFFGAVGGLLVSLCQDDARSRIESLGWMIAISAAAIFVRAALYLLRDTITATHKSVSVTLSDPPKDGF